jgi:hypothetical protein
MQQRPVKSPEDSAVEWVVLTMGNRPIELQRAVDSLAPNAVTIVINGGSSDLVDAQAQLIELPENLGVPGWSSRREPEWERLRSSASSTTMRSSAATARESSRNSLPTRSWAPWPSDSSTRIGETARRHVPRLGARDPERTGEVALFLGGACAIRRDAYEQVGGYFTDLFYGHEELELCWRLVDAGWKIRYLADVEVYHPQTTIERHPEGWEFTGP